MQNGNTPIRVVSVGLSTISVVSTRAVQSRSEAVINPGYVVLESLRELCSQYWGLI